MPADASGADRPPVTRPRPGPRRSRRRREVRARRHPQRARARQRARDGGARRGRRHRAPAARRRRHRDRQPRRPRSDRRRSPIRWRVTFERRARASRADTPLHCADADVEQRMIAEIDRAREAGDTMGGSFEVIAHDVPPGPRQPRAVGSQARRPPGAGADVDSRHQGGRHRPRPGRRRRCPARGSTTRFSPRAPARAGRRSGVTPADQQRRRPRRRRHQRRGPAGHRLHEADRDADEAAALGRSRHDDREPGGDRTQRRLRRARRRGRRRSDGRDRPRRRADREIRRRFDRGARRQLAGLPGSARPPASPSADRRPRQGTQSPQSSQSAESCNVLHAAATFPRVAQQSDTRAVTRFACIVAWPRDERATEHAHERHHRRRASLSIDELGPGMLESAYEACLAFELLDRGLRVERQKALPLIYRGQTLDCGYRIDLLVEDAVIVEVKVDRTLRARSRARSCSRICGCRMLK